MAQHIISPTADRKIRSIESLHKHLQWAIEVEHFTIPPYLTALYSIPTGKNIESAKIIKSVVMEEMLHMVLVANVMNAVGASPVIDKPDFIPKYPQAMPHSGDHFKVSLERFSKPAIATFMKIEQPQLKGAPVNADHYHTIGELYDAIEEGLKYLVKKLGHDAVFTGKRKNQISSQYYYGGGGVLFEVSCKETALAAMEEIKEQGEGFIHDPKSHKSIMDGDEKYGQEPEIAHFYRFNEVYEGKYYTKKDTASTGPRGKKFPRVWKDAYPMRKNPKAKDYPVGSSIRNKMNEFNKGYTELLRTMHKAFNGQPKLLIESVGKMYQLKYAAVALMHIPSGVGKTTVGPSFEYYPSI